MWSTGILILACVISFVLGEGSAFFIIGLFSANKEDKGNDDKQ